MLVTDMRRSRLPLPALVEAAVAGGVDAIYLRGGSITGDAGGPPSPAVVQALRARVGNEVALLVNGGIDAARASGAGLHLRERDPIPAGERDTPATRALLGRSVHSPEAAAASAGMDYLLAGHVYPSASKPGKPPLGLDGLAAIVAAAPCPVLAIGGISPPRVAEVIAAGAQGIAVIGAIAEADDPRAAASALRCALDHALSNVEESSRMSENSAQDHATIEIVVNGKMTPVPHQATVHDFLASKRMTGAMAIVERNGEIVPRGAYDSTTLAPGDRLEVVHAVGGG